MLPVLLLSGLSPLNALATNKLQGSFGTLTATHAMFKKGLIDRRAIWAPVSMALIGGAIGTILIQFINVSALNIIIPMALLGIGVYFLVVPSVGQVERKPRMSKKMFDRTVVPSIAFYDGVFGPGTGSFFSLSGIALRGQQIITSTAYAKLFNLSSNIASVALFIVGGHVVWLIGCAMMLGQVIGATVGANVVVSHGTKIIRPFMVVVCFLMVGRYFYQMFS